MQIFKNIFITVLHILICSNIGNSPLSTLYNVKLLKSLNKYLHLYIIYHFNTAWVLGIISLKLSNVRAHIQCLPKAGASFVGPKDLACQYFRWHYFNFVSSWDKVKNNHQINFWPSWPQVIIPTTSDQVGLKFHSFYNIIPNQD